MRLANIFVGVKDCSDAAAVGQIFTDCDCRVDADWRLIYILHLDGDRGECRGGWNPIVGHLDNQRVGRSRFVIEMASAAHIQRSRRRIQSEDSTFIAGNDLEIQLRTIGIRSENEHGIRIGLVITFRDGETLIGNDGRNVVRSDNNLSILDGRGAPTIAHDICKVGSSRPLWRVGELSVRLQYQGTASYWLLEQEGQRVPVFVRSQQLAGQRFTIVDRLNEGCRLRNVILKLIGPTVRQSVGTWHTSSVRPGCVSVTIISSRTLG